ncbi:MAG: HAD-IIB family hydrolase [Clostridia bacterium]|nr:HAD-IIB family hydrolase [Clostridia bacterium]
MIKLVAFDLDGTLTQHKTPLDPKNKSVLDRLAQKYKLLMVGAGQCARIHNQLGGYPIDVIGNYGLQYGKFDEASGELKIVRDEKFDCDRESVTARVAACREKYGFTDYAGESVEFHPSGCVTFAILGTKAVAADKLAFDPDRKKRRAIYDEVCETFSDYVVFVGGSSSFDMAPKPYNKYYALDLYCKEHGFSHDEVAFVGDDYGRGGNDESVYQSDFRFICVDDYTKLEEAVAELL